MESRPNIDFQIRLQIILLNILHIPLLFTSNRRQVADKLLFFLAVLSGNFQIITEHTAVEKEYQ